MTERRGVVYSYTQARPRWLSLRSENRETRSKTNYSPTTTTTTAFGWTENNRLDSRAAVGNRTLYSKPTAAAAILYIMYWE